MSKTYLFTLLISVGLLVDAQAQSILDLLKNLNPKVAPSLHVSASHRLLGCVPDSVHGYFYPTTTDSVLGYKQIYNKYGVDARTVYTYEDTDLTLYLKDSTSYDNLGRAIYKEIWEFNYDSMGIVLEERTWAYPHNGQINSQFPHIIQVITEILEPGSIYPYTYDSLVLMEKDFFTGSMLPEKKTVNVFDPSGFIVETIIYEWDNFGSMDWASSEKMTYAYTPSNKVDYTQYFEWDGVQFKLLQTEDYNYNANDSLVSTLITDEPSGIVTGKLELVYNETKNSTQLTSFGWDTGSLEWVEGLRILTDYDGMDRLETFEFAFSFFGIPEGSRLEYVYLTDNTCPDYANIYYSEDGVFWDLDAKYFYFPNAITSTFNPAFKPSLVYPNPATNGFWVEVPEGSLIQIATLQGQVIYRGVTSGTRTYIDLNQPYQQLALTIGHGATATTQLIHLIH